MLIECTFCHATAQIPDSKEGAKVKCGACGKVYVARDPSSKGAKKTNPTPYVIIGAALVGIVGVWLLVNSSRKPAAPLEAPKVVDAGPKVDLTGYESALCKVVRDIYEHAFRLNAGALKNLIHLPKVVERVRASPENAALPEYGSMTALERDDAFNAVVKVFFEGQDDSGLARWRPYDGSVISEGDTEVVVRVAVGGRVDANLAENRTMEWKLAKDKDGRWKAWSWERYFSPDELKPKRSSLPEGVTKVAIEGGGFIYQADPRPLPHLDDTPPEMRARIDKAVATLLDFNLRPPARTAAQAELFAIGKPALPILLTQMYEIRITDDDSLSKVAKVHQTLYDITGNDKVNFSVTSFGPDSDTKREMAVKQWFAWYLRKGERFEEKQEGVDLLEGLIEPTERDKRDMQKEKDKLKPGG